jgi:hypothetical protein
MSIALTISLIMSAMVWLFYNFFVKYIYIYVWSGASICSLLKAVTLFASKNKYIRVGLFIFLETEVYASKNEIKQQLRVVYLV